MSEHTPGPWDYVPSTEHHGPYVTSQFGNTICDFYVMSHPAEPSTASGGRSCPINFMAEMADDNARLAGAAPVMLAALRLIDEFAWTSLAADFPEAKAEVNRRVNACRAAIALATGEPS